MKLDPTSHPDATHSQASFGAHRSACAVAPSVGRLRQPNVARLACVRHAQRSAAGGPRLDARIVAHAPARLRTDGLDRLRHGLLELLGGGKGGCGSGSGSGIVRVRVRVRVGFGFVWGSAQGRVWVRVDCLRLPNDYLGRMLREEGEHGLRIGRCREAAGQLDDVRQQHAARVALEEGRPDQLGLGLGLG